MKKGEKRLFDANGNLRYRTRLLLRSEVTPRHSEAQGGGR